MNKDKEAKIQDFFLIQYLKENAALQKIEILTS